MRLKAIIPILSTVVGLVIFASSTKGSTDPEATLGFWLTPDREEALPHHAEYDLAEIWKELWIKEDENYRTLYEQSAGVKWAATNPGKDGQPQELILVFGQKVVWINGPEVKRGVWASGKVTWSDGSSENLFEFRRRGARRARRAKKVNFGKIQIPKNEAVETQFSPSMVKGIEGLLKSFSEGRAGTADFLAVVKMSTAGQSSWMNFSFDTSCSQEDREKLEQLLTEKIDPALSCWGSQDKAFRSQLTSVLLQRPTIYCKAHPAFPANACGMATLPLRKTFFVSTPQIYLPLNKCVGAEHLTLLHEILHLVGLKDSDNSLDKVQTQILSCLENSEESTFTGSLEGGEDFVNDLQVRARFQLFSLVRSQAQSAWGWTMGEQNYVLGTLCAQMNDALCARRYFGEAAEGGLTGEFTLDDGTRSTFSAAAQFGLFDSIKEDRQRMRELVKYLKRDPSAALLRRRERESIRSHEYYVVRTSLEKTKANKNVCDEEIDDRISCEDLGTLAKTNWFLKP